MREEPTNSTSGFKITDEIKDRVNALLDSNRTNARYCGRNCRSGRNSIL